MKSFLGKLFRQVIWESVFTLAEIAFGKYFPKEKSNLRKLIRKANFTFWNDFPKQKSNVLYLKSYKILWRK